MEHFEQSKTALQLPRIIFGTSALGNLYTELSETSKTDIVSECFKYCNLPVVFDCAGKCGAGLALECLGQSLEKLKIKPSDVIISNKLGWFRVDLKTSEPTFEPGVWKNLKYDAVQKISYKGILECWEQGNELFGNKYLPQMLSAHDPDEYIGKAKSRYEEEKLLHNILEAYEALYELKKAEKTKAIGIGAKNWKIIKTVLKHIQLDWVMFANSMTIKNHPVELLEFMVELASKKIAIINSAVFHAVFLTGGTFYDYKTIKPDSHENIAIFNWREKFYLICKKYNVIPAAACVNFALSPPGVKGISLNTSKPEHIKTNEELVQTNIPKEFYIEMKKEGLINKDYPYLNI